MFGEPPRELLLRGCAGGRSNSRGGSPNIAPTSAVIGNSQTRYLQPALHPYDTAAPAFITIRGATTFQIEVSFQVFQELELEHYGCDETLRRLRRLVNNTLRTRPELQKLVVSYVLPRHTNRRLDRPNDHFVKWFNWEARKFNETIRSYCRRPTKVTYVDYQFDSLPPRRFLAADGLHPSFLGVAVMAQTLRGLLIRDATTTAPGWSSKAVTASSPSHYQPATQTNRVPVRDATSSEPRINRSSCQPGEHQCSKPGRHSGEPRDRRHPPIVNTVQVPFPGVLAENIDGEFPTIAQSMTPGTPVQTTPLHIDDR
ncbi:hypothetical protein HPB48_023647 [Haemaphysalis longicornis]|uniref:Uncharacterized protein n=1 Tax=Haemaphysalis longicornis TaxID=44386 RepID=A0A9J6H5R5_HAELO|nr:hypothetical protein HPB48_023647 [Haemaphysalis longicornis]